MTLHEEMEKVKADLVAANTAADEAKAAHTASVEAVAKVNADLAKSVEAIAEKDKVIAGHVAQVTERDAKIVALETELKDAKAKLANPGYAAALAVGDAKAVVDGGTPTGVDASGKEVKAAYAKLTDPIERARFRLDHKVELGL
jgi:chromosome condensin MukBEF ATPase and DNA-binding subunit MukB